MMRTKPVCCKCGSKKDLNPWLGSVLYICRGCFDKEAKKLTEKYGGVVTISKSLDSLHSKEKEVEKE